MFTRLQNRGFTLIELLVVIAIIGILASVVLASLNDARDKGEDARVKSQLGSIRSQAEIYYDDHANSYGAADALCSDGDIATLLDTDGDGSPNGVCKSSASAYVVTVPLSTSGQHWCVDYTGASEQVSTAASAATDLCSAL